jgi:hypothetical protein
MTPEEKEQNREDIIIISKTKIGKYTKDELKYLLEAKGVLVKGNLAALKSACEWNGLAIQEGKMRLSSDGRENQRDCCKSFGREVSLIYQLTRATPSRATLTNLVIKHDVQLHGLCGEETML